MNIPKKRENFQLKEHPEVENKKPQPSIESILSLDFVTH